MATKSDPTIEQAIRGKRWIKLSEFAHLVDMDADTLKKLALRPGVPKLIRIGRSYFVRRKDVDEWIEETKKKRFFGPLK